MVLRGEFEKLGQGARFNTLFRGRELEKIRTGARFNTWFPGET